VLESTFVFGYGDNFWTERIDTMPRITRVYTRSGDDGSTALGGGQRRQKDDLRIEAYGTVDELSSQIGMARALGVEVGLDARLGRIQNELFHLGSDLCVLESDKESRPVPHISEQHVEQLESEMDELSGALQPLENFVLPGGSSGASCLHIARTVCRRAERLVVALRREEPIGAFALPYLNRLSDSLFVMARFENHAKGQPDVLWDSRA
jgi:cob(I)alamin adenosyltransferase